MITISLPLTLTAATLRRIFEDVQLTLLCESAICLDTKSQSAAQQRIFKAVEQTLSENARFALLFANKEKLQAILEWWAHYEIAVQLIQEFGMKNPQKAPAVSVQKLPMSIYGCSAEYADFF